MLGVFVWARRSIIALLTRQRILRLRLGDGVQADYDRHAHNHNQRETLMNTPSDQANRYAAPQAEVEDVNDDAEIGQLAGRGERLGAALLDALIWILTVVPFFIGIGWSLFLAMMRYSKSGHRPDFSGVDSSNLIVGISIGAIAMLAVLIVNIYFVVKNRQTIGKKLMGIKVTRLDGSQVSIARLFWLRNIVNAVPGAIPFIGRLYQLVDCLFIFGEQRRCVHDYIADTIVVKA